MHRHLLLVFFVAASLSAVVGQSATGSEGVYKLRGKAFYVGGYWKDKSSTAADEAPCRSNKMIPVDLVIGTDALTFKRKGSKGPACCKIRYKNIVVLSRGTPSGPNAKITQFATIATSLGSLLFGQLKPTIEVTDEEANTRTTRVPRRWQALTLSFAGAAVVSGFLWFRGSRSYNYIAVSYDTSKDFAGCQERNNAPGGPVGKTGSSETKPGNSGKDAPLFHKGNLAMFRLTNRHDYWNISMILSSATGCEFVSEEAEKK